jgi:hypothetical protein
MSTVAWDLSQDPAVIDAATFLAPYLPQMRLKPFAHQLIGTQALVKQPVFALFDEPGAGKTKQVIDPAQILFFLDKIDHVIVIAPASVRTWWTDPEMGELRKHLWEATPATITEYHARERTWHSGPEKAPRRLKWTVSNYDFIRNPHRLRALVNIASTERVLLVLDESSAVKSHKAQQTQSVRGLRWRCQRVVLLNGTPIENNPGDLFSQSYVMHPDILRCPTWLHFRSRYAIVAQHQKDFEQITGWQNIDDLRERLRPYVLRRLKKDCLDLPEKLPPVVIIARLTPRTWKIYKEMRDELVAWLSTQEAALSAQAAAKIMRLAQLIAGFIGGVIEVDDGDDVDMPQPAVATEGRPEWLPFVDNPSPRRYVPHDDVTMPAPELRDLHNIREIGREKADGIFEWLDDQLEQDPNIKIFIWCRFRVELYRLRAELLRKYGARMIIGSIHGAQKREERASSIRLLDPRTAPKEPVVVLGTLGTGARGINLAACHTVVYASNDFRYGTYVQSEERFHRPGQVHKVSYFDVIATGPDGQRTVDHVLLKARENKANLATWTTGAWVSELKKEHE